MAEDGSELNVSLGCSNDGVPISLRTVACRLGVVLTFGFCSKLGPGVPDNADIVEVVFSLFGFGIGANCKHVTEACICIVAKGSICRKS